MKKRTGSTLPGVSGRWGVMEGKKGKGEERKVFLKRSRPSAHSSKNFLGEIKRKKDRRGAILTVRAKEEKKSDARVLVLDAEAT